MLIGEVTLKMKCYKEFMELVGQAQKDLNEYLNRIEEAEKRDHRKLGKEMNLFHFREESPGSVFWHEKGWALFQKLINYMRNRQDEAGYKEVNTPEVSRQTIMGKIWTLGKIWRKHVYI